MLRVICLSVWIAVAGTARADESSSEIELIEATVQSFSRFWNERNAESLADLFTDDGDQITSDGKVIQGKSNLFDSFSKALSSPEFTDSKTTSLDVKVKLLTPTIAYADTRWKSIGITDGAGRRLPEREGRSFVLLTKEGGDWKIRALRSMRPHDNQEQ